MPVNNMRSDEIIQIEEELGLLRTRLANMERGWKQSRVVIIAITTAFLCFLFYRDFVAGIFATFMLTIFFALNLLWRRYDNSPRLVGELFLEPSHDDKIREWIKVREARLAELKRQA